MPIAFLLDEHFRGPLWEGILVRNARTSFPLDVVRVGDLSDLMTGAKDPDILLWAERESRILVSRDYHTLPRHLKLHLTAGRRSPGVILVRDRATLQEVVDWLEFYAELNAPEELQDLITYIP